MTVDKKLKTYRILVIDDNFSIHEDFRKILHRPISEKDKLMDMESELFGYKVDARSSAIFKIDFASQGKEGFEMALKAKTENRPYAMAFVDGRMPPGWDGIETINQLWKECSDLQVVFCTAYADYSWQEIRRVLGENDNLLILKKPFDNIEVLQLAHAMTRKWELNREVHHQIENLDNLVRIRTEEKDRARILLEAALKHSPAGIIISNEDVTKILWSNQAASDICDGYIELLFGGNIDGVNTLDASQPDGTRLKIEELPIFRAVLRDELVKNEEIVFNNNQECEKWVSCNAAPIRDSDGKKVAGIVIFYDITDRKRTEFDHNRLRDRLAQMQKMESVGLLAGGVAHDYNNAMSVIIGNAEMGMLSVDNTEPIYEILKEINKAAHRSAELTQQLLAFARKQAITPKILDLNKKIVDMLKILNRLIGENIEISWQPDEDLWHVRIDPSQFDQIVFNLCTNSRDAIEGVGKITIKTRNITFSKLDVAERPEFKFRKYAVLSVTDNGRGMEKEVLNRIFEPFYTTKEVGKGTGLGLATLYGIVKQNDGHIEVESEPEKGTTFTVYFPYSKGEEKNNVIEKPPIKEEGQGKKILIVEDTKEVLTIGKAMLEKLGYSVLIAHSQEEALEQAEKNNGSIDLLITDVIMPNMNGRDLADKLQKLYPELKCLFMSGYTADIISEQGIMDDSIHFLQKPFTFQSISSGVYAALNDE